MSSPCLHRTDDLVRDPAPPDQHFAGWVALSAFLVRVRARAREDEPDPQGKARRPGAGPTPRNRRMGWGTLASLFSCACARVRGRESSTLAEPVPDTDRIRAAEFSSPYGWSKPPEFAAIEGADPLAMDEVTEGIVPS
jgi:hypothetical protein